MRGTGLLLRLIIIGLVAFSLSSCYSYHSRDTEFTAQQRAEMSQAANPAHHPAHLN